MRDTNPFFFRLLTLLIVSLTAPSQKFGLVRLLMLLASIRMSTELFDLNFMRLVEWLVVGFLSPVDLFEFIHGAVPCGVSDCVIDFIRLRGGLILIGC